MAEKLSREEKLSILNEISGGDFLQLPEIGDRLNLRVLEDLQVSKNGKNLPLKVTPLPDEDQAARYASLGIVENEIYKFFIPRVGANHISKYIKQTNPDLTGCIITIKVEEWKNCPEDKIAERDLRGRAKSVTIIGARPEDEQDSSADGVEASEITKT